MKQSDFLKDIHSELIEIRRQIDSLRTSLESMKQELLARKEADALLPREGRGDLLGASAKTVSADALCKAYIDIVDTVQIARQVFVVEGEGGNPTIWTIVEARPKEKTLHAPYEEHLSTLGILQQNMPLEFHIVNVNQLARDKKLKGTTLANARLIWERH